jgi:hypothetical protein
MIPIPFLVRPRESMACTIDIEHTESSLHAHVELDGDVALMPGDRVRVHGAPIRIVFGQRMVLRRDVTVERAGWLEREWTKFAAGFGLSELYEVSFTPGRLI